MTRQNQYQNLMKMVHSNGMIDTDNGQLEYIEKYKHPIQIGTRLSDLVRSGYLISTPLGKGRNVWTLTQKGIDWNGEELVIKQYPKVKKTRAESEVKQECKDWNNYVNFEGDGLQIKLRKSNSGVKQTKEECNTYSKDMSIDSYKEYFGLNNGPLREKELHGVTINYNGKSKYVPLIEKEAPPIQSITRLERRKLGVSLFTRG